MKIEKKDLRWYGRTLDHEGIRYFDYSASGFEFCFTGTRAEATILSDPESWGETNKGYLGVYVCELKSEGDYKGESFWDSFSGELTKKIPLLNKENICTLFESEIPKTVVIKVLKISEAAFGYAGFKCLDIEGKQILTKPEEQTSMGYAGFSSEELGKSRKQKKALRLEFIGDSITCGYGIEGIWEKDTFTTAQERADKSYAFLTAQRLGAEFNMVSWSGIGVISNYIDEAVDLPDIHWLMGSLWNYTDKSLSLRLGLDPELWSEEKFSPDIVIIHLGTNDASYVRGKEERRLMYVNALRQLIEAVHRRSPRAKICCCLGVMGQDLCASVEEAVSLFKKEFPAVTAKAVRLPVQNEKDEIGADWHPSARTHQKTAELLAEELKVL